MNDYWHAISSGHQEKGKALASAHRITADRAFRNIVRHIQDEMEQTPGPAFNPGFLTGRKIEQTIDLISR